jgi:antirestriction protein ArdC
MSRPQNKNEYREELAESFAHILEEKGLNWKKEWRGAGGGAPFNGITKANYKGCNSFWLSLVSMMRGYNDPRWVTMVQIMDNDKKYHPGEKWHLKKGSTASYVEYWYPFDLKNKKALTWEQYSDELKSGRKETEFKLSTRYTAVFNACDIEGMPELPQFYNPNVSVDDLVTKLSESMKVQIINDGGNRAYYSPHQDMIHLPKPENFTGTYAYNATALHELGHSTGHPSRLNRPQGGFFGSEEYAYEELVAEMCSCFMGVNLSAEATPEHIENHKAYVQSWIQEIRDKPESLIRAIKDAQQAASYMDMKAGLISEKEYEKVCAGAMEVKINPGKTLER